MKPTFKQLFETTKYSKEDALARAESVKDKYEVLVLHKKGGGPNDYEVVAVDAYIRWPMDFRDHYETVKQMG